MTAKNNNKNSNGEIDSDIQQCRADILRAGDMLPPYGDKKANTQQTAENTLLTDDQKKTEDNQPARIPIVSVEATGDGETKDNTKKQIELPKNEKVQEMKADVPRFDLAEEIMAEHRKVTAFKRKPPEKKQEIAQDQTSTEREAAFDEPVVKIVKKDPLIAEIVARDIERLRFVSISKDK